METDNNFSINKKIITRYTRFTGAWIPNIGSKKYEIRGKIHDTDEIISNLLERYRDSEIKIKYVMQANSGIAAARNKGLESASGDGIMFMDQDDWLEKDGW